MGPGKKPARRKEEENSNDLPNKRKRKVEETIPATIRLNKYIAQSGVCSRREADELIKSGRIKVDSKVVTEMGYQVKLGYQQIQHLRDLILIISFHFWNIVRTIIKF